MDDRWSALVGVLQACGGAVAAAVRRLRAEALPATLGLDEGLGADGAPTSRIDRVAEEAALAYLERLPPRWRFNILSEECGLIDRGAALTLVIDPIDATNNAITDFPYYAFSVAALDGRPVAGCVINLPTGDEWTAARGAGARLNGRLLPAGTWRPRRSADVPETKLTWRSCGRCCLARAAFASPAAPRSCLPDRQRDAPWLHLEPLCQTLGEKIVDYAAARILGRAGRAL
jgi:fructose-1,6-bisphosphatase/inositol monophosphatase family enzyme